MKFFIVVSGLNAVTITFHKQDATVWGQDQVIKGEIDTLISNQGLLYLNQQSVPFEFSPEDKSFSVPIIITEGQNTIFVEVDSSGIPLYSDTLFLTLGYNLRPEVHAFATVSEQNVDLHVKIIDNPQNDNLYFDWVEDPSNPELFSISNITDSIAFLSVPAGSEHGEYYYNCTVTTNGMDTVRVRTFITIDSSGIQPFELTTDKASWIDKAIIYQITPYNFVGNGQLSDVIDKIPELADLGVNTLYLQPIYETYFGGQGYDIINYFKMREDYGTLSDLREFINLAKSFNLRVLFDFVPGHTSIHHPYAESTVSFGTSSHYYDFYKRTLDDAPYSMHYNIHPDGFIYYFWRDLPIIEYDNPEVQRWMIEAARYWVEKFDIDGYRIDAVWGINARNPEFAEKLRFVLKSIKPELLLLAEDKATWPSTFENRYDAAYDWTPEESWVSHWSWQWDYNPNGNPTIFNYPNENSRASLLKNALTNNGNGYHPQAKILRFMENNDTQRFIKHHDLERTKMVAAFMFSLFGIPMLYNGQEIGYRIHPYDTYSVYLPGTSIRNSDTKGLFPYYKSLIGLRKLHPALYSENYKEISVTPNNAQFAFHRWEEQENIFVLMNMAESAIAVSVTLPIDDLNLDTTEVYYLTNMLSGDVIQGYPEELEEIEMSLEGFHTNLFLLADTIMYVNSIDETVKTISGTYQLSQNYPNPFNPITMINYELPITSDINLSIYNVLGQKVKTLVSGKKKAGYHQVEWDATGYASGVYYYQLHTGEFQDVKKMILLR
jgi:glycosidase